MTPCTTTMNYETTQNQTETRFTDRRFQTTTIQVSGMLTMIITLVNKQQNEMVISNGYKVEIERKKVSWKLSSSFQTMFIVKKK